MQRSSVELQVVRMVSYKLFTEGILVQAGNPEKEIQ